MNNKIRSITYAAVVGAVYAALTMLLAPISYGPIQFRISECLCVLPFFDPVFAGGLFVGCLIANLMSTAGILDIVFGSLATLLAALCTAALGRRSKSWLSCVLGCLSPVLFNALIVGAVLAATVAPEGTAFGAAFALFGFQVGLGEAVVMLVLGLPLMRLLMKRGGTWLGLKTGE